MIMNKLKPVCWRHIFSHRRIDLFMKLDASGKAGIYTHSKCDLQMVMYPLYS